MCEHHRGPYRRSNNVAVDDHTDTMSLTKKKVLSHAAPYAPDPSQALYFLCPKPYTLHPGYPPIVPCYAVP